ncbi:hypothetical protein FACS189497_13130 [Betaproteobacteria bacterium]|nr:hypothetical protein FACS189497_13130 [Betaproteobacteria bacterium]
MAKVEAQIANAELDARELLNWQSRAFWIAPSLTRWAAVGTALEMLYLDEATRNKEIEAMRPLRFKVEEFELMKQRLAAGIAVTSESYRKIARQSYLEIHIADQGVKLPDIKPSHFRKNEIPYIFPAVESTTSSYNFWNKISLIDALSVYNGTSFQVDNIAPAFFAIPPEESDTEDAYGVPGVWDVGSFRVSFNGDALLHGINANGEPTARNLKTIMFCIGYLHDSQKNTMCNTRDKHSGSLVDTENWASVAGYATEAPALVRWAGKPMSGGAAARAQIKTRNLSGTSGNVALTVHEIDLNRDGVADFWVLQEKTDRPDTIFANIDGQWLRFAALRTKEDEDMYDH